MEYSKCNDKHPHAHPQQRQTLCFRRKPRGNFNFEEISRKKITPKKYGVNDLDQYKSSTDPRQPSRAQDSACRPQRPWEQRDRCAPDHLC